MAGVKCDRVIEYQKLLGQGKGLQSKKKPKTISGKWEIAAMHRLPLQEEN